LDNRSSGAIVWYLYIYRSMWTILGFLYIEVEELYLDIYI